MSEIQHDRTNRMRTRADAGPPGGAVAFDMNRHLGDDLHIDDRPSDGPRSFFDDGALAKSESSARTKLAALPTQPQMSVPSLGGALPPPTRFGRYVFAGEIGAGGMSVVYAARD